MKLLQILLVAKRYFKVPATVFVEQNLHCACDPQGADYTATL